ncbi:uncharacterized protein LOC135491242 [Lineus longissimus]|uniref:uncharacterized protein LOC135491242 n=1 Tax=Lineus longissimus TaxID=88925 RepID=UPI002B4E71BA
MAESMENYLHNVVQHHKDWLACTRRLCQEADAVLETFRSSVVETGHDGEPSIDPYCFPSEKEKEQIDKILGNKAAIVVTGRTNSGKSSILNTIFRTRILPVSENPCTARVVRLKYSERQYQRLISRHGTEVENVDVNTMKEIRDSSFIKMDDDARRNKESAAMVVEVGLKHELLQSGIEVLDSPGKSENPILDEVVDRLLQSGQIPLVVYVIDGRCGLLLADIDNIDAIQSKLPNCTIMYVCNKCDDDDIARSFDRESDCEESDDDDGEGRRMTVEAMKNRTFNQLQQRGFIPKEEVRESCKCFHGLSANSAMWGYRKKKQKEEFARYVKDFEAFERNLVDVLFSVLQRDISKIINIVMNNLATCSTIFDWAILGKGGAEDSDQLLSVVEEAKRVGKWWYDELRNVMNEHDIAAHMNFAMDLIERDLVKEIPSFTEDGRPVADREVDVQFLELKSRLDELGFNAEEMARKGTFCHAMRKMFSSYLFNTFKVTLEIRYKTKMDTLASELVNIMFSIAPSLRNMLKRSYRVRPSMMFDCDQLLGCTNLLFDVLQTILDAARITLRQKIDDVCDNDSIMYILMADNQHFSAEWCEIFARSLVKSLDVPALVLAIQDAALEQITGMFSNFTSSLTMITSISNEVKYQEESVLMSRKSVFMGHYMLCQAQAYGIETCMRYPNLQSMYAERIAVSQSGFPIRACKMEFCNGNGSNIAVKVVHGEDRSSRLLHLRQLLRTSEIQQHQNLLMLHGWILPSADCRLVIMERAQMNLVDAMHAGQVYIQRLMFGVQIGRALLHLVDQKPPYYFMDLKPRNILIGQDGQAKINTCKLESHFKETAEIMVPFHVSPQLHSALQRGETSIHPSNQIYAYGTLLWILAHGHVEAPSVFRFCNNVEEVQLKISNGVLPNKLVNIPADHWQIIEKCLKDYENLLLSDIVDELDQIVIVAERNERLGR